MTTTTDAPHMTARTAADHLDQLGAAFRGARETLDRGVRTAIALGMSEREAAARTGLNRQTVRRILGKE